MKINADELRSALERAVPPAMRARAPGFATVIAQLINGDITEDAAHAALEQDSDLLESLTDKAVGVGRTVVDFKGAIAGSVKVGDVAGRDLYNITIVVGGAAAVNIGDRTPLHYIEGRMAGVMKGTDVTVLRDVGTLLGIELEGTEEDKRWVLARKLLRADLDTVIAASAVLSGQLCSRAGSLVGLAAPFVCVESEAVAAVRQAVVPARRGLGVRSARTETGRMVAGAASWAPPMWEVREVEGGWGDDPDELEERVASAVEDAIGFDADDLDAELARLPVILVFPPPVPTAADVQALRDRGYAKVSFLFLTGEMTRTEFAALVLPDVDYVVPEIDWTREAANRNDIRRAVRDAEKACQGTGRI